MEGARQYIRSKKPNTKAGPSTTNKGGPSKGNGKPTAKKPADDDSDSDMPPLQDVSDSGDSEVDMPALSNSDEEMPKLENVSDSDDDNDTDDSIPSMRSVSDSDKDDGAAGYLSSDHESIPEMINASDSESEDEFIDTDGEMPNLSPLSGDEEQAVDRQLKIVVSPPRTYLETTEKPPVWRPVLGADDDAFIQAAQDEASISVENLAKRLSDCQVDTAKLQTELQTIEKQQTKASSKSADIRRQMDRIRAQKKKPHFIKRDIDAEQVKATAVADEIRLLQTKYDSAKSRLNTVTSTYKHIESLQRLSRTLNDEAGLICLDLFEKVVAAGGEKGAKLALLSKGLLYSSGWITTIHATHSRVFLRAPNGHYPFDIALDLIEGEKPVSYPLDVLQIKCADLRVPPQVLKDIRRKLEYYYHARIQQGGMHWEEFVDLMAAKGFQQGKCQGDKASFGPPVPTRRSPNVLLPKPRCVPYLTQQMLLELDILLLKNWGWTYADAEAALSKDKKKPPFGHRQDGWGTLVVPFQDAFVNQSKLEKWIVDTDTTIRRVKVVGYGDEQAVRSVGEWSMFMRQEHSVDVWQEDE